MIKSVAEHCQILVDFLGGNLRISLCRGNVRMPQYSAYTLNGNALTQSQRSEPMASAMEGNILRNTALFYHLFPWFTDVPIVEIGKYKFVLLESLISPDYLQWNIQQLHLEIDLCFVSLG